MVETLSSRTVDLYCVQETGYWRDHCLIIRAKTQSINCSGIDICTSIQTVPR